MISTENLSIAWHGRMVLRNASINARAGRILGIVGPSGCGKSSYLAAINRMTDLIAGAKVSGHVRFGGRLIDEVFPSPSELRRHVGMIFQKPNPFPMSIRRNIQMALREHGLRDRRQLDELTEQVLRNVGLWDEIHHRLDQSALELSGGQQQRLCIARALALKPQVLLMDEPCSSLDPIATDRVEQLIRSMRGQYTIVIVTHNLAQARRISDDIAVFWMQDGVGEIIEQGECERLFTAPETEITRSYLSGKCG